MVLLLILFRKEVFGGNAPPTPSATGADPTPAQPHAPSDAKLLAPTDDTGTASRAPASAPADANAPEPKDPRTIDLARIPDFQPTPDTSPEEWAQLTEWVAQWLDVDAGAAGKLAEQELLRHTRKAVPAILNAFKRLDFATETGRNAGDRCQKALRQICNGAHFDWRSADAAGGRPYSHPDDVWFCKHVVERWSESWKASEQDIRAWIDLARLEEKDPAEARRLLEMFGSQKDSSETGDDDKAK